VEPSRYDHPKVRGRGESLEGLGSDLAANSCCGQGKQTSVMTGNFLKLRAEELFGKEDGRVHFMVKPNELLVTVSSTHYCAYTSVLST
jgi:hypothetical protein